MLTYRTVHQLLHLHEWTVVAEIVTGGKLTAGVGKK
jgi:hypothetical protein